MTNEEPLSMGYEPLLSVQVQLDEVLTALEAQRGAVLYGAAGSGKTMMLRALKSRLQAQGRAVFLINADRVTSEADLDEAIRSEIAASEHAAALPPERTLRSSTGGAAIRDVVTLLQTVAQRLDRPVLLVDALGSSRTSSRVTAAISSLIYEAHEWSFVFTTRERVVAALPTDILRRLRAVEMGPVNFEQARVFLERALPPGTSDVELEGLIRLAQGNRLFLTVLADAVAQGAIEPTSTSESATEHLLDRFARRFLQGVPAPFMSALELLALHGTLPEDALTQGADVTSDEMTAWLQSPVASVLIKADANSDLRLSHSMFAELIFRSDLLSQPITLSELQFGSEEAERDDLLAATYVVSGDADQLLASGRTIVIGDRGAGKSALFRRLRESSSAATSEPRVSAVSDIGSIMQRIIDKNEWHDAETLRAAWLIFAAAATATIVPEMRERGYKRDAAGSATLVQPRRTPSLWRRTVRAVLRPFAGTNLKFAVGPMTVEAQLPGTATSPRAPVDVETFLSAADQLLIEKAEIAAVLVDRVDEASKG